MAVKILYSINVVQYYNNTILKQKVNIQRKNVSGIKKKFFALISGHKNR